mgnify:CR=1 FL=1
MWKEAIILNYCNIESALIFMNRAIELGFEYKVEAGRILYHEILPNSLFKTTRRKTYRTSVPVHPGSSLSTT